MPDPAFTADVERNTRMDTELNEKGRWVRFWAASRWTQSMSFGFARPQRHTVFLKAYH